MSAREKAREAVRLYDKNLFIAVTTVTFNHLLGKLILTPS